MDKAAAPLLSRPVAPFCRTERKRAHTAAVYYSECFLRGIEPTVADKAAEAAEMFAGTDRVNRDRPPVLASEDFAHMAAARPGCFLYTGNGTEGPNAQPLHATDYDFNDDALVPGSSYWVQLVEHVLKP